MPKITSADGTKLYYEEAGSARRLFSFMNSPAITAPGSRRCDILRARTAA